MISVRYSLCVEELAIDNILFLLVYLRSNNGKLVALRVTPSDLEKVLEKGLFLFGNC